MMYLIVLWKVLGSSKLVITQSSYIPGQNFPEKDDDLNGIKFAIFPYFYCLALFVLFWTVCLGIYGLIHCM